MARGTVQFRLLWPTLLSSSVLIGVCAVMAVSLFHEQAAVGMVLHENIESRRAVGDLEENLADLKALLENRVEEVDALHARIDDHMQAVGRYVDHPEERDLAAAVAESLRRYRGLWKNLPPTSSPDHAAAVREAIGVLQNETLPRCQALSAHNSVRVEQSALDHQRVLRELAWGIAAVGGTGGIAGLVLGYGMARGVRRSIHRLQIGMRDAAGRLGQPVSEIVLTGDGDLGELEGQLQGLAEQVGRVVDELQQRDREVARAEQLAAVGQLAAGVAHEIRNPLTAIKMLVQAARTGMPHEALSAEDLGVIEAEVRRMERSLQTFLDFARPPTPLRTPTDVGKVVSQTLDLIRGRAAKQRVELRSDAPAGPVRLVADPDQLRQVLVNLCLNALDAMPGGGTLTVRLRAGFAGGAVLTVLDTGSGIPPAMLPKLFVPFASGKDTGLGLGLVICRRIVEDHGGTIRGSNLSDGGACFTVELPAAAA